MNQENQKFEIHIPVDEESKTAVELLSLATELSKQKIKQVMQNGAVWLTHDDHTSRLRRVKRKLEKGDELHLYYDEAVQSALPETPELIADEGDYSVFFKPQGMLSQGSKWGDQCTINRWVEQNMDRPAFIVHRLDRAATGLILIAHTKTAAAALSKLFEQRQIDKRYRARVYGRLEPSPMVLDSEIDGRKALSKVELLEYDEVKNCSLLEINIETGRKHQIRRHLSEAGYPIVGDRMYGQADAPKTDADIVDQEPNLQLVATELSFVDSFGETDTEKESGSKSNVWKSSKADNAVKMAKVTKSYTVPDSLLTPELRRLIAEKPSGTIWPIRNTP
jgi:tRNA pseudouridine32 synthase/23S rRNA pseudouridine746 synthase